MAGAGEKEIDIFTIEEYNKELRDADASMENVNYRTNEQVMEAAKKMIAKKR